MMPHPTIVTYDPPTGRALIDHGEHLTAWMSVDDLYDQAYAWFDLARELRGRNLAVEAVEATEYLDSGGVLEFNVAPEEPCPCGECGGTLFDHRCTNCGTRHGDVSEVADILRRPWAYDEADPRFEGKAS